MAILTRAMLLVAILASFTSLAFGIAGEATFYTDYKPSACYEYQEQGTMIAAVNPRTYNNMAACGRMYRITCTNGSSCRRGSVVVKVVDLCPTCADHGFDLSKQAFSAIANPDAGRIKIDYVR